MPLQLPSPRALVRWSVLLLILAALVIPRPDLALRVATGSTAHDLCSETFVAGLDPQRIFEESLKPRPGYRVIAPAIDWQIDREHRSVEASFWGLLKSRAVYRKGYGCVLAFPGRPLPADLVLPPSQTPVLLGAIAPKDLVKPTDPRLAAALEEAFVEPESGPHRWTTSVVVLHDGQVVAERYAPGYGIDTPILGFSMTKSVTNALVGILVQRGRLSVGARAPIAAWDHPEDPRRAITLEQLMRMDSGLELDETGSGFDPSNRMFYDEPDMAAYAEQARQIAPPGTRWHYSSASTHLVARIVRDAVGGNAAAVLAFANDALFHPLGLEHVELELDATGTPIGAHYLFASARDWARFGWLYAEDGIVGGVRMLPEGWVAFSGEPTLDSDYGAGFWTNRARNENAQGRVAQGMPEETLYASGNLGQRIAIIPAEHLVIVRTGHSHGPDYDMEGFIRLVRATRLAFQAPTHSADARARAGSQRL